MEDDVGGLVAEGASPAALSPEWTVLVIGEIREIAIDFDLGYLAGAEASDTKFIRWQIGVL